MRDIIIKDNLEIVLESLALIRKRFAKLKTSHDFTSSDYGVLVLDAITMRLQVIGEVLKKINKIDPSLLADYPEIEWNHIMRFRDIVSHHYEKVDHEIVFDICRNHLPDLQQTIEKVIETEF